MKLYILNVGYGTNIRDGWVNLDITPLPGVDIIHDLGMLPLPFENLTFEEILCQDVLEHVEYIPILEDLHRIMRKNAEITIRVPHFTSRHNFTDPTHKKMFSIDTFNFFVKNSFQNDGRSYYFNFSFELLVSSKIIFERGSLVFFLNPLFEKLFNISPRVQRIYEATFLSRFFPACNILVTLKK